MSMTNKTKEVIRIACLLTDIHLCTLNVLELIISHTSIVPTIGRKRLIEHKSIFFIKDMT